MQQLISDFPKCDLLLVMGTSLEVYPFAALIERVRVGVPRVLLNRECVGQHQQIHDFLGMKKDS